MKALIVHRDHATRQLLAKLLTRLGWEVTPVAQPAEKGEPSEPPPHLVLWDSGQPTDKLLPKAGRGHQDTSDEALPLVIAVSSGKGAIGDRLPAGFDDLLAGEPDEQAWGLRLEAISRRAMAAEQGHARGRALESELTSLRRLIALYERERQLAAFEIHDGLAQQLAAALMHLDCFPEALKVDPDRALRELALAADRTRQASAEARRLIAGLRPPLLDEEGLAPALSLLVEQARGQIHHIDLDCRLDSLRLAPLVEHAAFRIVQEALSNAVRHSRAERALVRIEKTDSLLAIEVRDWGVGFDVQRTRPSQYGLSGISERARLLGGEASIDSSPGRGTTVRVQLPLAG